MIRRLLQRRDFERLLAVPARLRSAHFAVHHLPVCPSVPGKFAPTPLPDELSTGSSTVSDGNVDNSPRAVWFGAVVPKRHARRAVTRNLLRRQIYTAAGRHAAALPRGLWLVRLHRPFNPPGQPPRFRSAASDALRRAAAAELDHLMRRAAS